MPLNTQLRTIPPINSKRFVIAGILIVCAVLQVFNSLPGINLNNLGIYPRHISGLFGIFFAPVLHGGWIHFLSNLIPFTVLSWLVCQYSIQRFWVVFIFTTLAGGSCVWLFGRSNIHIGLSGVTYGLWGYLITYGFMHRSFKAMAISVCVLFLYSGFILGILPQRMHISFESHLFGALSGILIGYYLAKQDRKYGR